MSITSRPARRSPPASAACSDGLDRRTSRPTTTAPGPSCSLSATPMRAASDSFSWSGTRPRMS